MLSRGWRRHDEGQLTPLVIGYTFVAAVLIVAGIDASKVFLARRALSSAADAAALAAAQAVDRGAVYAGQSSRCGTPLPLDPATAAGRADATFADQRPGLAHTFTRLDPPATTVTAGTTTVRLAGTVAVPFGHVLALLLGQRDGFVRVTAVSSAQSPLMTAAGC
jgi:uncharacterized membrane protein